VRHDVIVPAPPRWLVAAKIALIGLLAVGAAFPDLGGFAGKGMGFRLLAFSVPALAVPAVVAWRRPAAYPAALDAGLTLPFLIDTAANAVGLYDSWGPTDDVLHLVNWIVLLAGVTAHLAASPVGAGATRALLWTSGFGLGAASIVGWEAAEWVVMQAGVAGLDLTYDDTIGDLLLSTAGGGVGAVIALRSDGGRPDRGRVAAP
jgi:hypothetical protein